MGVTASIVTAVAAVGTSIYSGVTQAKAANKADAEAKALAAQPAPNAATDNNTANTAALDAQRRVRAQASGANGRASTILTGPAGVATAPPKPPTLSPVTPGAKTLLGS